MNKPKGVYSTNVAQGEQTRAIDLLPPDFRERVYPVGRLDAESRGLLLLTNDGELTNQLTHPRYGVAKTYRAIVDGFVTPRVGRGTGEGRLAGGSEERQGVQDRPQPHQDRQADARQERPGDHDPRGPQPQVRRMLAKAGHKVRDLTRIRMGPLTLHGLDPGDVRMLTPREVRELKSLAERKPRRDADDERRIAPMVIAARPVTPAAFCIAGRLGPHPRPAPCGGRSWACRSSAMRVDVPRRTFT